MTFWQGFFDVAREAVKAETNTWAGRSNFLGLTALFLLLFVPAFLVDVVQAAVRVFKPHYTTGLPSATSIAVTYGVLMLLCVIALGIVEVLRARER
jgi:hypothetical protein